jgi:DNA-binding NarL/FixJ family response regulator
VKNHVSRIFSKLNISARTQAAVHAIRAGIV